MDNSINIQFVLSIFPEFEKIKFLNQTWGGKVHDFYLLVEAMYEGYRLTYKIDDFGNYIHSKTTYENDQFNEEIINQFKLDKYDFADIRSANYEALESPLYRLKILIDSFNKIFE